MGYIDSRLTNTVDMGGGSKARERGNRRSKGHSVSRTRPGGRRVAGGVKRRRLLPSPVAGLVVSYRTTVSIESESEDGGRSSLADSQTPPATVPGTGAGRIADAYSLVTGGYYGLGTGRLCWSSDET